MDRGLVKRFFDWTAQSDRWFEKRQAEAADRRTEHGGAMRDVLARLEAEREAPQDATIAADDEGVLGGGT